MVQPSGVSHAVVVPDARVLLRVRVLVHIDVDVVVRGRLPHAAQKQARLVDVPAHQFVQLPVILDPRPVKVGQVLVDLVQQVPARLVLVHGNVLRPHKLSLCVPQVHLAHPHSLAVKLCQLAVSLHPRFHVVQRNAAVQNVVQSLPVLQLQVQFCQLVVGDPPRFARLVHKPDVDQVMGKMVQLPLVRLAGHVVKDPCPFDQDLRFLPLPVIQHPAKVLHVPAVGVSAHPFKHPLNVHGVHPVAVKFPVKFPQPSVSPAHAACLFQFLLRPLGKLVNGRILLCAHHHVVDLDNVHRLV